MLNQLVGSHARIIGLPIFKVKGIPIDFSGSLFHAMKLPKADSLGGRVRALRKMRDWSQATLAGKLYISQGSLSDIETGESKDIASSTMAQILKVFEVSQDWLQTGRSSPARPEVLSIEESELMTLYRVLDPKLQDELLSFARFKAGSVKAKPSRTLPYAKIK